MIVAQGAQSVSPSGTETTYTVNMSGVEAICGEMAAVTKQIQSMLEELDNGSAQNLSAWESSARDIYNQCKAKWDQAAAEMATESVRATQQLGEINQAYAQGERTGMSLWQG